MFPLSRIVDRAASLYGRQVAVSDGAVRLSYAELAGRVKALAGGLLARGLRPGDRVAILGHNSFRYLEANLACAYAGLILVPLNTRLAGAEYDRILQRTETSLLLQALPHDPGTVAALRWSDDEPPGAPNDYEAMIAAATPLEQPASVEPDSIAQIFFTSGTTGEPKGVCLTEANLLSSALDSIVALELTGDDVWLHAPPMFHLVDAFAIWAVSLVGGRHVTTHFDPMRFGPLVQAERITQTSLPPTLLDMIVRLSPIGDYDLASLERISYGGAPMPDASFDRCAAALGCDLLQAYGITETGGMVCQQLPRDLRHDGATRRNSVGQPVLSIDLRIVDDDARDVADGEIGEFAVAGARVMAGYWRDPTATAAAIPDGWYRTGDLGIRNADGHFTVVGRKKEMIISGGENVYPTEVENALLAHPEVVEAAVFGVPSERWGEEVRAIVVLAAGGTATPVTLMGHCRGLIGGYKIPKIIEISPEPLPKSGPGKIAKALLRAPYWEKRS
ncbi:MAG: fatty-acid--CoA ligase [Rhodospirillales bacterium]|nr:fatty-acid--CoA ligase [Rhodospirillales bacterium]